MHEVQAMSIISNILSYYVHKLITVDLVKLIEPKPEERKPSPERTTPIVNVLNVYGKGKDKWQIKFTVKDNVPTFIEIPDGAKSFTLMIRFIYGQGHTCATLAERLTEVYGKAFVFKWN